MKQPIGYFSLVLHSHLPYVLGHGNWPHGMDWLHEAAAESYIPLLNVLNRLLDENISPKITIGFSPVLAEQLTDDLFKKDFIRYLEDKIKLAESDQNQFMAYHYRHLAVLAKHWQEFYQSILNDFQSKYQSDIIGAYKKLQDEGHIEIITSAATHGYFPLLSQDSSLRAQTKMAVKFYTRIFGTEPKGMWLPECGYRPRYSWRPPVSSRAGKRPYLRKGTEEILEEAGIKYFFTDEHLLHGGKPVGVYIQRYEALRKLWGAYSSQYHVLPEEEAKSPYQAYQVSSLNDYSKPIAVLTRDSKTAIQVWSGEIGYPAHGNYLDFHKKYYSSRHRYWRITSPQTDLADKQEYIPDSARNQIKEDAEHFIKSVSDILKNEYEKSGVKGILCAPFDTELFGHWWFEGPEFIYHVIKNIAQNKQSGNIGLITGHEYIQSAKPIKSITLPEGSWGEGGFHYIWLNEWTEWTWKHIYDAEVELQELLEQYGHNQDERIQKVLKQCARELLLLESSDWQFLISTWSARDYAEMRLNEHYQNFVRLVQLVEHLAESKEADVGEWNFYQDINQQNRLFPDIELDWFRVNNDL